MLIMISSNEDVLKSCISLQKKFEEVLQWEGKKGILTQMQKKHAMKDVVLKY